MSLKAVVILGPTSSGKSALAVALAKRFDGEIISADSRQVYKGLDIGSGKITRSEMKGVRHHLLDVVSPRAIFTAADFVRRGRRAIADISKRDKVPIICGGTGFYIDALLGRIALPDVPADAKLRIHLQKKTPKQLYAMLQKLDPRRAKSIDKANSVRLVRAIEIAKAIGISPLAEPRSPYDILWVGLKAEKIALRKKIRDRLLARMKLGMVHEAHKLHLNGVSWLRMESLGLEYRYLARFLQKKMARDEMLLELDTRIAQYAKRQVIYWKRNKDIRWFSPQDTGAIEKAVSSFLTQKSPHSSR